MSIRKVAVIGSGAMGMGIVQVVAQSGYEVSMQDISQAALDRAMGTITKGLEKAVAKGKLAEEAKNSALANIKVTTSLEEAVAGADLVVEAVFEDLAVKKELFAKIAPLVSEEAILGTNTSALPISAIAFGVPKPERVIGIHFMNPVPAMRGVEVIPGLLTSEDVTSTTLAWVESIGKIPAKAKDLAGFIASRVLDLMMNEGIFCVMDGNSPEDVDKAMKYCCNHPMGPCELTDLVGADILLHAMETLHRELGDKYRPAPLLAQMVRAGKLGQKTGAGFYNYKK